MKEKILTIVRSLAVLLAFTILFSLFFSALYYYHVISQNMFHILNWIFGACAFGAAGVLLGMGVNKKALLHAFVIALIIAIGGFLYMDSYTWIAILEFISKLALYMLGSVLAVNVKAKA